MIELMVTMSIIVLLAGIVVVGFKHVGANSQKDQTKTILERMRTITSLTTNDKAAGTRFFRQQIPYVYSFTVAQHTAATPPTFPASPANTWDGVPADADDALFRTGLILKALTAGSEAKRIFDDVPTERKKVFHFQNANGQLTDTSSPTTTTSFTLPLDAWGNPMLFVYDGWADAVGVASTPHLSTRIGGSPAPEVGGLTNLISESAKTYWQFGTAQGANDPGYATRYTTPTTPPYAKVGNAWRSPDHLPFWVSAGPDGRFQTHDDNVYSFEN